MRVLLHPIVYIKAVYRTFFEDGISIHAAGLSFKTLLSLIPENPYKDQVWHYDPETGEVN